MSRGVSVGILARLRVLPPKNKCLILCCGRILSLLQIVYT